MIAARGIGEIIWGFMLTLWVAGTFIRWAFPRYSERMLRRAGK